MNLAISKLYQVKNGGELSPQDCQKINAELSVMNAKDIPNEQRENVADYLTAALNCQSVQPQFVGRLDVLLQELQENA
jgi:hypothetical protein